LSLSSERRLRATTKRSPQDSIRAKPPPPAEDRRHNRESNVDPLTGVFDRAHFDARLREEFEGARRSGDNFILVCFDVDEFRVLTNTYGRRAGNEALRLVAQAISSNARQTDVIARYGNDEFIVLMSAPSLVEARDFFERVRTEVAQRSKRRLGSTVCLSAGGVKSLNTSASPTELLETAEYAVYLAKRQGKDRLFTTVAIGRVEAEEED
jgi:two-component system cell cycle response regulator